jgi:nucleoside-diphosphate-sugar epimerase
LPGLVARRFACSRIVALSTGNVYPFSDVRTGGARETDPSGPIGEYAQSCLGRERMFEYFSGVLKTPVTLIRLNYANALRYGVLTDLAMKVKLSQPIDLTTGYVNVIWQGDANAAILQSLALCASPPSALNVSGPETASVRWLATGLAELMGARPPTFVGTEAGTALLSNCARQYALFGYPSVPLGKLLAWTADWVGRDRPTWDKPTHFETREGAF